MTRWAVEFREYRNFCENGRKTADVWRKMPGRSESLPPVPRPHTADVGTVRFDQQAIEARQDAQVGLLLKGEPFSLIILGGAHDLSDNVERLSERPSTSVGSWRRGRKSPARVGRRRSESGNR
jgi:hypothetical protein